MKWESREGDGKEGVKMDSGPTKPGCEQPSSPEASSAYLGTNYNTHFLFCNFELHRSRAQTLGEAHTGQVQRGWFLCDEHWRVPRGKQPPGIINSAYQPDLTTWSTSWRLKRRAEPRWRPAPSRKSSAASPPTWWAPFLRHVWTRALFQGPPSSSQEVTLLNLSTSWSTKLSDTMRPSAPLRTHDFLYKESKRAKLEREKEERRKRREVEIEFAPEVWT